MSNGAFISPHAIKNPSRLSPEMGSGIPENDLDNYVNKSPSAHSSGVAPPATCNAGLVEHRGQYCGMASPPSSRGADVAAASDPLACRGRAPPAPGQAARLQATTRWNRRSAPSAMTSPSLPPAAASANSTPSSPTFCARRRGPSATQPGGIARRRGIGDARRDHATRAPRESQAARPRLGGDAEGSSSPSLRGRRGRPAAPARGLHRRRSPGRWLIVSSRLPEVSPLTQSARRLRLKKVTRPVRCVASNASRFM